MPRTIRNTVGEFTKTTDTKTISRLPWISNRSSLRPEPENQRQVRVRGVEISEK
jgi:hypothetical protein